MQPSFRHDTFSRKTKPRRNLRRWGIYLLLLFVSLGGVFMIINAQYRTTTDTPTTKPAANGAQKSTMSETGSATAARQISLVSSKGLQSVIDGWIATHGTGYRAVVRSLDDESFAANYKATTITVPASIYKLFVSYAAYHLAEQGKLTLSVPLSNGLTVEQCIEKAIVNSNNACAEAIGNHVGWETIDQIDARAGFTDTKIDNYDADGSYTGDKQSTAANLATYLEQLHKGTLLNDVNTKTLLGYMKHQVYRTGIPAGSSGVAVVDKVGFLDTVTHDAAIVYAPRGTYVLVIMSTTGNNWANIKDLAAAIYHYLN